MLKKILAWLLVISTTAAIAIGGTLAYLTDRDSEANVFTTGDVDITLNDEFKQGSQLKPGVEIEKNISIKNEGPNEAYVWYTYAVPQGLENGLDLEFDNKNAWTNEETAIGIYTDVETDIVYNVYVCKYNAKLAAGETTPVGLTKVTMNSAVDITPDGDAYLVVEGETTSLNWNINETEQPVIFVNAFAIQTNEFDTFDAAYTAFVGQWGSMVDAGTYEVTVVLAPADAVEVTAATTYEEFAALISAGKNLNIVEDVTIANPENSRFTALTVSGKVGIYSDNDATLTFGETTTVTGDGVITVYRGSIVENQELCIAGNSTLVFEGGEHTLNAFSVASNGSIVVNNGILNCKGTYAGILGMTFAENGSAVINGGTLNMDQPFNLNQDRCDNAYIEINGGTINLSSEIDKLFAVRNIMGKDSTSGVLRGSSIKITGGVFTAPFPMDDTGDANAFIRNEDSNCDTTRVLTGNTYNGAEQYNCVVTGGTFYGCWTRTGETGGDGTEVCENTISGFVADGYEMTGDATNGYTVTAK